jgi:hypothetical protein
MATFRLSQTKDRGRTVVNIDGQVTGDCVQVLETCCSQAISAGAPVSVFLRDVSVIDEAGRELLRRLANQGVQLLASGLYTSYLINHLQPARAVSRPATRGRTEI